MTAPLATGGDGPGHGTVGDALSRPGTDDAVRATVGVVLAYAAALLFGVLVALLAGGVSGESRTAGSERAQLAVQSVAFALAALLLIEGLRLAHRPRTLDTPLVAAPRPRVHWPTVLTVGLTGAIGASLVGPLVSQVLPHISDPATPVADLGVGTGLASDLGTVLVVVGLVPLGEELLFRGVLAGAWLRAGRPVVAVVLSTLLFGLAHVTVGPRTMVVAALLGALFAAALMLSGSLGAPVLAHCVVNAVALIDAGLDDLVPLVLLVVVVAVTTAVASRLSPLVSWPATGGTLTE